MVHYMASTCETMAHGPGDIDIWRKLVPEEAGKIEFLMDGLLALSSLHFASQNSSARWQYTEIAIQYQISGLRKYTIALEGITDDNINALFTFSIIITILALAFPNVCPGLAHSSHTESIMSMCELLQGVRFINQAARFSFQSGKLRGLFRPPSEQIGQCAPGGEAANALLKLRERADSIAESADPEKYQAYLSGIESLKETFACMEASRHLGPVIAWPAMVNEKLLRLFKQGDSMAQFVFMNYGVSLLHTRDRWWGRDVGVRLIENLATSLHTADPEWATWTEWAKKTAALATLKDC